MKNWIKVLCAIIFVLFLMYPICIIFEYNNGIAELKYIGKNWSEFNNLDREYRCKTYSSGCNVVGHERFFYAINNGLVKWLIRNFGYQKNSFTGFYPTEEEAKRLLINKGKDIYLKDESVSIFFENKEVFIEITSDIDNWIINQEFHDNTAPSSKLKARYYKKDDCIILKLIHAPNKSKYNNIYLINKRNMQQFALYAQY